MTSAERPIYVTEQDMRRLTGLLGSPLRQRFEREANALEAELARARVVPMGEIPPDVVTMNSQVCFEDRTRGGLRRDVTLVYPWDADVVRGRISVLDPLGITLIGLSIGDTVRCTLADGSELELCVLQVLFQPESNGDAFL
jgi:regulator of nucleoside diphosphate kinase